MTNPTVAFQGAGPHHLPCVQRAIATGQRGNAVTLVLYVLDASGQSLLPVETQMLPGVARDMAKSLLQAAGAAE